MKSLAKQMAEMMREQGISELELEYDRTNAPRIVKVVLDPRWSPPEAPAEPPVLDSTDPVANALAQREWEEKRRAQRLIELQAEEDRVRFAHTEGA